MAGKDVKGHGSAEDHEVSPLALLPDSLIAYLWPCQRIIHGLCIGNRALSEVLRKHIVRLDLRPKPDLVTIKEDESAWHKVEALGHLVLRKSTGKDLRVLNFRGNHLGEVGLLALRKWVCLPRLMELDLSDAGLDGGLGCFWALSQVLKLCTNLQELSLRDNKSLGWGFGSLQDRTDLSCARPALTLKAFKNLTSLRKLDLADIHLTVWGVRNLAPWLCKLTSLVELTLNGLAMGTGGSRLRDFLPPSLVKLSLGWVQGVSRVALGTALEHITGLKKLHVPWCGMGLDDPRGLLSLTRLTQLELLDLRGNDRTPDGQQWNAWKNPAELQAVLSALTCMRDIDLDDNWLREAGGVAVARAIACMPHLKFFSCNHNSLGLEAGLALATSFRHLTNLEFILLYGNSLGEEGMKAIIDAALINTNLECLWLHNNGLESDALERLRSHAAEERHPELDLRFEV